MADKNEKCHKNEESIKPYGFGIRHIQMACMWLTAAALFMARGSMGVAVLAMSDEKKRNDTSITIYHWDKQTQSVILSSFFWGYLIMQIPGGLLAKKFGGKPILLVALLANGTICLLIPTLAALGGWSLVCASRVIMGLTQACLYPGCHTLLGQWLPPNEQTAYTGLVYGGVQIGTILTMPISGLLADTALGWKMIFYTISGILFATAAIWYGLAASSPQCHRMISIEERIYIESKLNIGSSKKRPRIPWKSIVTSRGFLGIQAVHLGYSASFVLFFVDLPTYLEKGLGISLRNGPYRRSESVSDHVTNAIAVFVIEFRYNKDGLTESITDHVTNAILVLVIVLRYDKDGESVSHVIAKAFRSAVGPKSASLSALPYIGMFIGTTVSSLLSEKILNMKLISLVASRKIFGSVAMFGVALGLVSLSFMNADHRTLAIVVLITTLTASGFATTGHLVNQLDLSPNNAGVIMSLINFVANIGTIMVPLMTGLILGADPTDVGRWRIVFLIHASVCIVSNTIFLILGTSDRQAWDDPDFLDKKKADPEEMNALNKEKEDEATRIQIS